MRADAVVRPERGTKSRPRKRPGTSELLDAIEHHGEHFMIVRHGKAIAELEPANPSRGKDAKALLRRRRPDREWLGDLREVRDLLEADVKL